jgi:Zn-dependent protease
MYGERPPQVQGEYQAPAPFQQPHRGWGKAAGGTAVGLGFLALKFKTLLLVLFSLKWIFVAGKFALAFWGIFVSLGLYMVLFGWQLGVMIVVLILVHELGHYFFWRALDVPVSLPQFVPFVGAYVQRHAQTENAAHDAGGALAGPIVGILASAACHAYGIAAHSPFWIAVAHFGYFINAFNLIPIPMFDGGHVAATLNPRLWVLGFVIFAAYIIFTPHRGAFGWLFLIIIGVLSIGRIVSAWRGEVDPRILKLSAATRGVIALCYFVTVAFAVGGSAVTDIQP